MKNLFTQHEIVLVTSADYYQRQLIGLDDDAAGEQRKAYWNTHINDLLLRIVNPDLWSHPLTVRHTRTSTKVLKMEFASTEITLEKQRSIDPAFFLSTMNQN